MRFLHDGGVDATPDDAVLDLVGPRLRALRAERGLSIAELSAATGISPSKISRLEGGLRRASLDVLLPLARTYRVSLDDLVGAPATADPRLHPVPITRHGMTFLPLTRRPGGIGAYKVLVPVGHPRGEQEQRTHEGYEWLYVLDGSLRLRLGEHEMVLRPGEAAEFDTRTPHLIATAGDQACELLMLMGPQGQRAHLRARPKRSTGPTD